nr:MAG TPA: YopX protein [Caudoviricetes sp.]
MKREIKFRAKRKDNNKWAFGDLVKDNAGGAWIETNLQTWGENCDDVDAFGSRLYVDIDTVGQFTGRNDKNGKEIYEGDILRHLSGKIFLVLYSNRTTSFILISISPKDVSLDLGIYDTENCFEVIGNIYDNKELWED